MTHRTVESTAAKLSVMSLALFFVTGMTKVASAYSVVGTFGGQTLYSNIQYNTCLAVSGSNNQVYSDTCDGSSSQEFTWDGLHLMWTSGGTTYYMTDHGTYVTMDTEDFSSDQEWDVEGSNLTKDSDHTKCLDVYQADQTSGTQLDVATCNGTDAQWFWLPSYTMQLEVYPGSYCLAETTSGGYDIEQCCQEAGGSSCTTAQMNAQYFTLTNDGSIQNTTSTKCLLVNSNGSLTQATCNASFWTAGQQWPDDGSTDVWGFFSDNYYGLCLDVYGGATQTAGTTVDASSYACEDNSFNNGAGNRAQFWEPIWN